MTIGSPEIALLLERAADRGVVLDRSSAKVIASLGEPFATRKLDSLCRLLREAREEGVSLSARSGLRRLEICGGNVEEAIRRAIAGGPEAREGVPETVEYAAVRGITFTPRTIYGLFSKRGRDGTERYIDQLGEIMDWAPLLGVDCTQARAIRRLSLAEGDAQWVISAFAAERRRRLDRQTVSCRVKVEPRTLPARSNSFAGCGCRRCRDRLTVQMERYIGKMIADSLFDDLDREEARAEANLALVGAIETWPGGNFTGWFATCFERRVLNIYKSRSAAEREMLSLDVAEILSEGGGGRRVTPLERIPELSEDPLTIVIMREERAQPRIERRQLCAERATEFMSRHTVASRR